MKETLYTLLDQRTKPRARRVLLAAKLQSPVGTVIGVILLDPRHTDIDKIRIHQVGAVFIALQPLINDLLGIFQSAGDVFGDSTKVSISVVAYPFVEVRSAREIEIASSHVCIATRSHMRKGVGVRKVVAVFPCGIAETIVPVEPRSRIEDPLLTAVLCLSAYCVEPIEVLGLVFLGDFG